MLPPASLDPVEFDVGSARCRDVFPGGSSASCLIGGSSGATTDDGTRLRIPHAEV
jgi:hypothetical protein